MRRFGWLAALAALCACAASPERDAEADCQPRAVLSPAGDGLRASYALCTPVTAFAFEPYNTPQRAADWTVPPGWLFDGGTLRRADGGAFENFELRLAPDSRFYDRRYVAVDRVGAGWTVFVEALRPAHGGLGLTFSGFAPDDVLYAEGRTRPAAAAALLLTEEADAIVYVGSLENVTPGAITVIAGDEIPPWLRQKLITDMNRVIDRMTARFGRTLSGPTLIVTHRAEWRGQGFKGGVVGGEIVEIRLRGIDLTADEPSLGALLTNLAAHEAVHFWIGHIWKAARNDEEPWLHEGGAEYLASRLWQDAESLRAESEQRLNNCLLRTGGPLDGSEGPVHGNASYDCGFTLMLAAETASLRAGRGDVFDLWHAVVEAAGGDGFTPAAFLSEARARGGQAFDDTAAIVLARAGDPRATALGERLSALGVVAAPREADEAEAFTVRGLALMPVLGRSCQGSHGFSTLPDRLRFDTGARCGPALAGDPEVVSVNGIDLMRAPGAAHAAIRSRCAAGGELRFGTFDGGTLAAVLCNAEITPLPPIYAVHRLPALPAP